MWIFKWISDYAELIGHDPAFRILLRFAALGSALLQNGK
jgi:hypothetical protein